MHSRAEPSQDYVDLLAEYKELHKDPKYFNGICLITHLNTVSNIILKEGARSVLDYGCGKALLYDDEKYKSMRLNKGRHCLNLYTRYGNLIIMLYMTLPILNIVSYQKI